VGKKPRQSQKGGSHGLTLRTSARLSHKKEKKKKKNKNKNKNNKIVCFFFLQVAGDLTELRRAACAQKENRKNYFFIFLFLFLFFLSQGTLLDVAFCPPPTSYLYNYIRLLMSLISLFYFCSHLW
jgi:hypothetical protein